MKHLTANGMFLLRQPCLFSFNKNTHHTSDMVTKPAGKQQRSDKSLKTKYKTLKELENNTPHKDVAPLFGVSKIIFFTRKKIKKKSSIRMNVNLGLKR